MVQTPSSEHMPQD